jgi:uncharacterized membrane protein YsdA (DUF1294 family)
VDRTGSCGTVLVLHEFRHRITKCSLVYEVVRVVLVKIEQIFGQLKLHLFGLRPDT